MYMAGSCRFDATCTDEQQAQRKERRSKHKQWYSGSDHFLCKMVNQGMRHALYVGTAADDQDGTTVNPRLTEDLHHRGRGSRRSGGQRSWSGQWVRSERRRGLEQQLGGGSGSRSVTTTVKKMLETVVLLTKALQQNPQ